MPSCAQLEAAERLANIGSWHWDIPRDVITWSPQLYEILGYSQNVIPSQALWFSRIYPEDLRRLQNSGRFRLSEGAPPPMEFRIQRTTGELRTVRMQTEFISGNQDLVTELRGVIMDISAERRLEQELRHAHKMQAIGRLAGGVAHDFNNLLAVIRAHTERLQRLQQRAEEGRLGDAQKAMQSLEAIDHAVDLAAQMTQRLLNFGRRDPEQPRPLDINSSIENAATLIRRVIGDHVQIRLALAAGLPTVKLDEGQLHQTLMNLAANARDAMPNGGELVISTEHSVHHFHTVDGERVDFGGVQIIVADSGLGMTEEVQARALDPFFTTKAPGKGTGLGLSGVYAFAVESGGKMEMISSPGKGTQVSLHFPAAPEHDSTPPPPSERHMRAPQRPLHLCVVEDNEDVLKPLVAHLREAGHHVLAHAEAEAALQSLRETPSPPFDALLTDLMMAGMSGVELVAHARAHDPKLPVIMMTGYSSQDALPSDRRTELLRKPFSAAQLLDALARVTDREAAPASSGRQHPSLVPM